MAERDRLRGAIEHMRGVLKGARVPRGDFYKLCVLLAKAIDNTLVANQTPHSTSDLIQLLKQAFKQKEDAEVRPAVAVLMLSVKIAIRQGWFKDVEHGEVFAVVNAMLDLYDKQSQSVATTPSDAERCINNVLLRFYPWLKLERVLFCFEAEAGYKAFLNDFYIDHPVPVRLFTIRKDKAETPLCLVPPTSANFLLNGNPIEKRANGQMENGPQPPADCTRFYRHGINFLQTIGEFPALYLIAVAIIKMIPLKSTLLDLPEFSFESHADDDLTEGPSKVSLCCPISRQRILTPVKGYSCKHLQCFDYKNYLEINSRRPLWRCPYCNVVVTVKDLRMDTKMAKILTETNTDVMDVLLSNDGSWTLEGNDMEVRTKKNRNIMVALIDLADNDDEPATKHTFSPNSTAPANMFSAVTTEDRKPDITNLPASRLSTTSTAQATSSFPRPSMQPSRLVSENAAAFNMNIPEFWQRRLASASNAPTARFWAQSPQDTERLRQQLLAIQNQAQVQAQQVLHVHHPQQQPAQVLDAERVRQLAAVQQARLVHQHTQRQLAQQTSRSQAQSQQSQLQQTLLQQTYAQPMQTQMQQSHGLAQAPQPQLRQVHHALAAQQQLQQAQQQPQQSQTLYVPSALASQFQRQQFRPVVIGLQQQQEQQPETGVPVAYWQRSTRSSPAGVWSQGHTEGHTDAS